jgi:hypothetical protein
MSWRQKCSQLTLESWKKTLHTVKRFDEFVAMLTIAIAMMLFLVLLQLITASP